jgi:hypothetical protein
MSDGKIDPKKNANILSGDDLVKTTKGGNVELTEEESSFGRGPFGRQ